MWFLDQLKGQNNLLFWELSLSKHLNWPKCLREGLKKSGKSPFEVFWALFVKNKCIFTIENSKQTLKIFQKIIKLHLDKQLFASSDAITAATSKILSTTRAILALTWFCHLSIYLWRLGGAWGAPRGDPPPIYEKNFNFWKWFLDHLEPKKLKKLHMENDPRWPPPH